MAKNDVLQAPQIEDAKIPEPLQPAPGFHAAREAFDNNCAARNHPPSNYDPRYCDCGELEYH